MTAGAIGLATLLPNHSASAFEIKSEGEITINGLGDISVTDLYWIDGNFQMRGDISDMDGDGFVDVYSWQRTPQEDGNVFVMANNKGITSGEAFKRGIKPEDYFGNFGTYVCNWNPDDTHYGNCIDITHKDKTRRGKDTKALLDNQAYFSKETAEYFQP